MKESIPSTPTEPGYKQEISFSALGNPDSAGVVILKDGESRMAEKITVESLLCA